MPRISKKELQRRNRISSALKAYHADKKLIEELNQSLERELYRKKFGWKVFNERTKIKSFPDKKNKSKFFFATKRKYRLNNGIKVENDRDISQVKKYITRVKPHIVKDIKKVRKKRKKKNTVINLGYRIKMRFWNKDKTEFTDVNNTSYKEAFTAFNDNEVSKQVQLMQNAMIKSFKEYISQNGFGNLKFFGLESEVHEDESVSDEFTQEFESTPKNKKSKRKYTRRRIHRSK